MARGEVYNVGGPDEAENIEVVRRILGGCGRDESLIEHVRDRPGHDRRYSLSSDKVRALGWEAEVGAARPLRPFGTPLTAPAWRPGSASRTPRAPPSEDGAGSTVVLLAGPGGAQGREHATPARATKKAVMRTQGAWPAWPGY